MKTGNFAFELADLRAEQEREAGIARAQAAIRGQGAFECEDCGDPIEEKRREALPSAKRCIDCERRRERLKGKLGVLRRPRGRG